MEKSIQEIPHISAEENSVRLSFLRITPILMGAYIITCLAGMIWKNLFLIEFSIASCVLLVIPWILLARGFLRLGGFLVLMNVLISVTVLSTVGQGIHDQAIIAYPVVIIIAGLFMNRFDYFFTSLLTLLAVAWLVFGENFGLFASQPYEVPGIADFIVVGTILTTTTIAVNLLAENMRKNMRQAQQEISQRKLVEAALRQQSTHDSLTGLYNRTMFEQELARLELNKVTPVSIVVADVDDLKVINDLKGHAQGDELLRRTAKVLSSVFRSKDILARIGGDEFAVLLPGTDGTHVEQILNRIQTNLTENNAHYPELPIKLSLGAATTDHGKLLDAFVTADKHMYANKALRKSQKNK